MSKYFLSAAIIILLGGFVGWGIAAAQGGVPAAQSSGTAWGAGIGLLVAIGYYLITRKR